MSVDPGRCLQTSDRRLQIQTVVPLSIRMSLGLPEAGEIFDLPQHGLSLLLELGGEAAAGAQEEVGAGFSPENGPLVVEEEGTVGGEGGGQGEEGAGPGTQS